MFSERSEQSYCPKSCTFWFSSAVAPWVSVTVPLKKHLLCFENFDFFDFFCSISKFSNLFFSMKKNIFFVRIFFYDLEYISSFGLAHSHHSGAGAGRSTVGNSKIAPFFALDVIWRTPTWWILCATLTLSIRYRHMIAYAIGSNSNQYAEG